VKPFANSPAIGARGYVLTAQSAANRDFIRFAFPFPSSPLYREERERNGQVAALKLMGSKREEEI
jgi:hypothetical protein